MCQPIGVDQINRKGEAHLGLCQPKGEEEANGRTQIVMYQPTGGGESRNKPHSGREVQPLEEGEVNGKLQ